MVFSLKIFYISCEALILSCLCLPVQTFNSFIFVPFMHHFSPYVRSLNLSFPPINLPQVQNKSPTSSNPKPSPSCPPACAFSPVFICQLSANPSPTPPRRHFYLFSRALQNNHPHPASHAQYAFLIFAYF